MIEYTFKISRLSEEDGGGYLAEALDLQGCMADGETPEEAIHELEDAIAAWIDTAKAFNIQVPNPSFYNEQICEIH